MAFGCSDRRAMGMTFLLRHPNSSPGLQGDYLKAVLLTNHRNATDDSKPTILCRNCATGNHQVVQSNGRHTSVIHLAQETSNPLASSYVVPLVANKTWSHMFTEVTLLLSSQHSIANRLKGSVTKCSSAPTN